MTAKIEGTNALKLGELIMPMRNNIINTLRESITIREVMQQENKELRKEIDKIKNSLKNKDANIRNRDKLYDYSLFENNWNLYGAKPFSTKLLNLAWNKIRELEIQPEVFPTMCDSIQFEYEKENGDYLEFEIYEDRIEVFEIIDGDEDEYNLDVSYDLNKIVNVFHDNNKAVYYFYRGNRYLNIQPYNEAVLEKAILNYTKAIKLDPNYAEAYIGRGNCFYAYYYISYYDLYQLEMAIKDYTKAMELDPSKEFLLDTIEACKKLMEG